ncbi:HAD-IA family hydrolase [Klenkia taihuensis]|uniref:2-haloacid dehalogenase n=1 Tax=Klenkia taihuensis TaxID=1225127 RepID=A0A1I1HKP3_9ACTN|nr:HAD-IA family hydrolase [Klenkia taihuensis]GHE09146.1 haloacid dehalogenase [Klenkia taihuensis]SFC24122.1 2-haloacid dehalogenase [Klenkia taihuensis]
MTRTRPAVVAFDVVETLLDVGPVAAALADRGVPAELFGTVFGRTLGTGFAATLTGAWCSFRDSFDAALAQLTDLDDEARSAVADVFGDLAPHPDVRPALDLLAGAGVRAVTLTHGGPGVAEAGLARGGVDHLVERSLSSQAIRAWKPAPEVYLWAAGVCDVVPADLALVAVHGWDVHGAQRAGLTGGWAARAERRHAPVLDEPHVSGADLVEVVRGLLALPPQG